MMIRHLLASSLLALTVPCAADDKSAAAPEPVKPAKAPSAGSLPKDVLMFFGKVTGTVESLDNEGKQLKIKVTEATANSEKNKAPKPETLRGMTITITPLEKKQKDGTKKLDAAVLEWMKGAETGDSVTISIRASSKGEVFRLLSVPTAAPK